MRRFAYTVAAALMLTGGPTYLGFTLAWAEVKAAPALSVLPPGYRDWRLISVAHEEGKLNDIRAILGNDIAINAIREGRTPFPDGAIIARLAWNYVSSEENNKAFGQLQSFIAGRPTNVQFMVKDSKKYASTGGWGFVQFNNGKPVIQPGLVLVSPVTCLSRPGILSSVGIHRNPRRRFKPVATTQQLCRPLVAELKAKQLKIDQITHEMAILRRCRYDRRSVGPGAAFFSRPA